MARSAAGVLAGITLLASVMACAPSDTASESGSASSDESQAAAASTAAANAFLGTLDASQKDAVSFEWSDTQQKQRWSNLPHGIFERAGLRWGDLDAAQQKAWMAMMDASLSDEGYHRVLAEWAADEAYAAQTGQTDRYGRDNYFLSIVGAPSDTEPWLWQFGGHHLALNIIVVGGHVSATPSFIGDQPSSYTDASGKVVRPLGDIEDQAFALVNSLNESQRQSAILGPTPINLVLGAGQDGKTIAAEGLPLAQMTDAQRAAARTVIAHYVGLVDDPSRVQEADAQLDQTYFAWYGPTTPGTAAYFRFTGPTVLIEYSPQGDFQGNTTPTNAHIHGIYRDPTNEYGSKYAP